MPVEVEAGKVELRSCSWVHSETFLPRINEALLVSAYDIHHALLTGAEFFSDGFSKSLYARLRVLIIDSGGYEIRGRPSGGAFVEGVDDPAPWTDALFQETIDALDNNVCASVVNWDATETKYDEQIARAQDFFGGRSRFASTILLKPPGGRFHQFQTLSDEAASNLRAFDVIGVTDKELGENIVNRMQGIADLRSKLDEADVLKPIHVFGGLDPLLTPLYFAAGAEVFDGLGWLRYAYRGGIAMSREAGVILDGRTVHRWERTLAEISFENLNQIDQLTEDIRVFADQQGDWSKFGLQGDSLKLVYERFQAQPKQRGRRGRK